MTRFSFIIASLFFITVNISKASSEVPSDTLIAKIAFYADVAQNADRTIHRVQANKELVTALDLFFSSKNSFEVKFDKVPWINELRSVDEQFRLISWQLSNGDSTFHQFGYIQLKNDRSFKLIDSENIDDLAYSTKSAADWYGAIYYDMKPFVYEGRMCYLLSGFLSESRNYRQKICDVLYFDNLEPYFGLPVFAESEQDAKRYGKYRLQMRYSAGTRAYMQYNEDKELLMMDHIISHMGGFTDGEPALVTDGSYEAYKIDKKGVWRYIEKVYSQKSTEPPSVKKSMEKNVKKDIFGNPIQN